jgi:hypothetical protein
VHVAGVIGADGPVSFGRKGQKNRSPPAGNEKSFRVVFGVCRYEAPEEEIASSATRFSRFLVDRVSKAGRKSGFPKKGRRTLGDFGWDHGPFQARPIERPASLRAT